MGREGEGTYTRASCGGIEDSVNGWEGSEGKQSADGEHTRTEEVG